MQFLIKIGGKSEDCHHPSWFLGLDARKTVKLDKVTDVPTEVLKMVFKGIAHGNSFPTLHKGADGKSNDIAASLPRPWPRVPLHEDPQSPYLWS
jgi:hypothetical protein